MAKVKTTSSPALTTYNVTKVTELNFFDLTGEKAKTAGSSNKSYHLELWISKDGTKAELFSTYGATGGTQNKDYRYYDTDITEAEKEFDRIIRSKKKKGYVEIDVAQRAVGSEAAKQITKPVVLKNAEHLTTITKSSLHQETQRLISTLMGATNQFVIQTLKCPLGQLTNQQIDIGKDILEKAKVIVNSARPNKDKLLELTNSFYAAIPHNLGSGHRGQMVELILNDLQKIAEKEDTLDTLLDAKGLGAVLSSTSKIDDQYNSLNAEFAYIDHSSELFGWLNSMIQDTRANNHTYLGKVKLLNAWSVNRKNERDRFLNVVNELSKDSSHVSLPKFLKELVPNRPDKDDNHKQYYKTNTWPLFHGTRTQNITGIVSKGFLIRPAGVVICGAMYGHGVYFSSNSTKSINYTSIANSYWAKGADKVSYLFLNDIVMGNILKAKGPSQYTLKNIAPNHSVWAQGGQSGVINDEMMIYDVKQSNIRYLLEFECR